ncbi:hypothetical protein Pfo_018602 [Paulownia fortunei]|nr:hypothetical protein Pfo_018602 [Paulownia fortunei]
MESANFYQLQKQEVGSYSSLAAQSTHGVAAIHEWNPSLHLNNDDYDRYMNEILPNSMELQTKNSNFPDMGCDDYESSANPSTNSVQNAVDLNGNLWLSTSFSSNEQVCRQQPSTRELYSSQASWAKFSSPAASSSNNYVFNSITTGSSNLGLSTSSLDSTHLATDFMSYLNNGENCSHSPKKNLSLSCIDRIHQNSSYIPSRSSNKTSPCRNEANPGTKRVSTSSHRRPSHDQAAKKPRAVSQSSCPLPKVGKEKIGDRIAALHRLVAPFGKTDTASVLTEAIGYVQFLQDQIQTLSMPCIKPSHSDRRHCFQGVCCKQDHKGLEAKQDLRSRGLCLVPLSFASYISSSCTGLGGM